MDIEKIKSKIRDIPDFPKKGIIFKDIFPIFQEPTCVEYLITHFVHYIQTNFEKIDVIVGLDARGFLIGPIIALRLNLPFVPVRKQGKLPGKVLEASYTKEYGTDVFEMQQNAIKPGDRVIIVDDLIATGGSAKTASELVKKSQGILLCFLFIIELEFLKGSNNLDGPVYSLIKDF